MTIWHLVDWSTCSFSDGPEVTELVIDHLTGLVYSCLIARPIGLCMCFLLLAECPSTKKIHSCNLRIIYTFLWGPEPMSKSRPVPNADKT